MRGSAWTQICQLFRNTSQPEESMAELIVVYGADWCGDRVRTLRHLDRSGVKYDYIDIDNDKEGEEKVIAHSNGRRRIPLVEVATDGGEPQRIAVPRDAELDSMLGKK